MFSLRVSKAALWIRLVASLHYVRPRIVALRFFISSVCSFLHVFSDRIHSLNIIYTVMPGSDPASQLSPVQEIPHQVQDDTFINFLSIKSSSKSITQFSNYPIN